MSELVKLGCWVEYSFHVITTDFRRTQLLIDLKNVNLVRVIEIYSKLIDCKKLTITKILQFLKQIDYVRFSSFKGERIYIPKTRYLLLIDKLHPNIPEALKDKYFSKKEMENLIELKDIINN